MPADEPLGGPVESAGGVRSIRELFDTINVQGNSIDRQEVEQFFLLTGSPSQTLCQSAILLFQELLSSLTSLQQLRKRMARYLLSTLSRYQLRQPVTDDTNGVALNSSCAAEDPPD